MELELFRWVCCSHLSFFIYPTRTQLISDQNWMLSPFKNNTKWNIRCNLIQENIYKLHTYCTVTVVAWTYRINTNEWKNKKKIRMCVPVWFLSFEKDINLILCRAAIVQPTQILGLARSPLSPFFLKTLNKFII